MGVGRDRGANASSRLPIRQARPNRSPATQVHVRARTQRGGVADVPLRPNTPRDYGSRSASRGKQRMGKRRRQGLGVRLSN